MNGGVASMGEKRQVCKVFWWENFEDISHLEDLDADGGIIFKMILMKWDWRASAGIIGSGWGKMNKLLYVQIPQER